MSAENKQTLEGQIAIVTGSSEGIGKGIVKELKSRGAKVILVARTLEKLENTKQELEKDGGDVEIRPADIKDTDSMKNLIEGVYQDNGRLDIFVNNAGGYKPLSTNSEFSSIRDMIELDLMAPLAITHYLVGRFKGENDNHLRILNVISQAALMPLSEGLGYGTAKMGLNAAMFHIKEELSREGISNISLYNLYPATVGTPKVMEGIRTGELKIENPTSLESVVSTALDMLQDNTPTRDVYVGYLLGEGIKRVYLKSDPSDFNLIALLKHDEEIVDKDFNPDSLL